MVPLEAAVRVGNGSESVLGNDNPFPAGYASLDLVLGRAQSARAHEHDTYGLRLGAAGFIEDASDRDGIIGTTPLGFVFFRPVIVHGRRLVGEAHTIVSLGPTTRRPSRSRPAR